MGRTDCPSALILKHSPEWAPGFIYGGTIVNQCADNNDPINFEDFAKQKANRRQEEIKRRNADNDRILPAWLKFKDMHQPTP